MYIEEIIDEARKSIHKLLKENKSHSFVASEINAMVFHGSAYKKMTSSQRKTTKEFVKEIKQLLKVKSKRTKIDR